MRRSIGEGSLRPARTRRAQVALAFVVAGAVGCGGDDSKSGACPGPSPAAPSASAPRSDAERFHLGHHVRKVSTRTPEAQAAFDRGLTLAFSFAYDAAEEEFRRAAQADPACAMAWWGVALVNGPHINFPIVPPDRAKAAWEALGRAKGAAVGASESEKSLIDALATRYADPQPEDRRPLDEAYAKAMRGVWAAHPADADVAVLFADAMFDLRPWDLWTNAGVAQPGTEEIVATLEKALALAPDHPGALHLYIHAVEASPHPEKGIAAADRLRDLVPGLSHMVHMPSHIYARVGRWAEAAAANERAIAADAWYRAQHPRPGFYATYMAHNRQFLAYTATMRGRSAEALAAARDMVAVVPPEFVDGFAPIIEGFLVLPLEVLMRFGRWDDILKEPEPKASLLFSRTIRHATRAIALTALGRLDEAGVERTAFREAAKKLPPEWMCGNSPASAVAEVVSHVLDGEMAAKASKVDEAVKILTEGAALQDALRYDEPPDWIQPVRHTLGAVLMKAGRAVEAEAVYREDLARYAENGWSLLGLAQALHAQGRHEESMAVDARARKAFADADVKPTTTCFCIPGETPK